MEEITIGPCRLINADCGTILKDMPRVDAIVTDPPYENMKGGTSIAWGGGVAARKATITIGTELGTAEVIQECRNICKAAICFCSFQWIAKCQEMLSGKPVALLTWFKRNTPASVNNAPWFSTEFAWAVQYESAVNWRKLKTHFDIPMLQAGCFATERLIDNSGKSLHPTQKPIALMRAMLLPGMDVVCDPYMGTGTTAVACIQEERKFIGIERDPQFFALAVARVRKAWELKQSELPFEKPLFEEQSTFWEEKE